MGHFLVYHFLLEGISVILIQNFGFLEIFGNFNPYLYFMACCLVWEGEIFYILMKFLGLLVRCIVHFHLVVLRSSLYPSYMVRVVFSSFLMIYID